MKKQADYNIHRRFPKIFRNVLLVSIILILVLTLSACKLVTVVKLDENSQGDSQSSDKTDLKKYVEDIWDEKAMPVFEEKAVDFATVYDVIKKDLQEASVQYSSNPSNNSVFVVKGSGVIKKVDKKSSNGKITIDMPDYGSEADLIVQVGPVITGTVIRDALPFVKFDDYENQISFAQLADAFNNHIIKNALTDTQFTEGQEIDFVAVFGLKKAEDPVVATPVYLHERG